MKKIIGFILIIIIGLLTLTGCSNSEVKADERRFEKICDEGTFGIYYDIKTKVMYAIRDWGYNAGTVTLLVNADGTPLLYGGE